jgi:DNA-binding beta-propeller fold protein YncE
MRKSSRIVLHLVLLILLTSFMISCGSDSNGSSNDDPTPPSVPRYAITANSNDNTATIFNTTTLEVLSEAIPISGEWPWEITLSGDGAIAYIMNRDSNNISIVSMSSGTETGTIELSGSGPAKAVIASDGFLYVSYRESGFISKVDIAASPAQEVSQIALTNSLNWLSIAATPAGSILYVGAENGALSKVDVSLGEEVGSWTEVPSYIWDIKIDASGMAYFGTYDAGVVPRWDTTVDDWAEPVASGQPYEWMVDLALDGTTLLGTYNGGDDNGGLVMIDTLADYDNYAYGQDDDSDYDVTLPFTFNFLGTGYDAVTMNSNGAVSFNGYVDYDDGIEEILGFAPNNEDLDSGNYIFNYSSMTLADRAVFQWSTSMNDDEPNPRYVSVFEVVLFANGTARFDYLFSMPDAINEDDETSYGVGDGSGTALVDMRALYGSPYELTRRSFLWNPATPGTVTEVAFQWEGTGVLHLPVNGQPHGIAFTDQYIFVSLSKDYETGLPSTSVEIYDRSTLLPSGTVTVGAGPRAIAIQP